MSDENSNVIWADKVKLVFDSGIAASGKASNLTVNLAYVLFRAAGTEEINGPQLIVYAKGTDQSAARDIIADLCEVHSNRFTKARDIFENKNLSQDIRNENGDVMRAAKAMMRDAARVAAFLIVDKATSWNVVYDLGRKGNKLVKVPTTVDVKVVYHDRSGRIAVTGYETIDGELGPSEQFGTRSFLGSELKRLATKMFKKEKDPATADTKPDASGDVTISKIDLERACSRVTLEADKAFKEIGNKNVAFLQDVLLHLVVLFNGIDNVSKIVEHESAKNGQEKVEFDDKKVDKAKAAKAAATSATAKAA